MSPTPQDEHWQGQAGDAYTERNVVQWQHRMSFWQTMIVMTGARSVLDVGCNVGWNLLALRNAAPNVQVAGCDINMAALTKAMALGLPVMRCHASQVASVLGYESFDLVCTSGVLIHIGPNQLASIMKSLINASKRWVLAVEYSAPREVEVIYRGEPDLLWKRPYGLLYRELGLHLHDAGRADGFDQCDFWLLRKP